jgi:hypothetical protein
MRDAPRVVVFLGPSLPLAEARALLPGATFAGPARLGDVYRACRQRPAALLIVDGVFDQELAVWHKEILWALAHGIRVYGAASMGALRAAELSAFGMVGVGEIFQAFSRGELEDDDEVAVAHERADGGFRPLGEAMVNIRATLLRAEREGLIDTATRQRLIDAGKALFYPQRSLAAILAGDPAPDAGTQRLARWIAGSPGARVDQKRLDAEAALRRLAADAPTFAERAPPPSFHFEYTEAWHELRRRLTAGSERSEGSDQYR